MTRYLVPIVVVFAVALAGCSGAGWGGDGPAEDAGESNGDTEELEEADEETNSQEAGAEEADASAAKPVEIGDADGEPESGTTTGAESEIDSDGDSDTDGDSRTEDGDATDDAEPLSEADTSDDNGSNANTDGGSDESDDTAATDTATEEDADSNDGDSPIDEGDAGDADTNGNTDVDESDEGDDGSEATHIGIVRVVDGAGDPVEGERVVVYGEGAGEDVYETNANGQVVLEFTSSVSDHAVEREVTVQDRTEYFWIEGGEQTLEFVIDDEADANGETGDAGEETETENENESESESESENGNESDDRATQRLAVA